MSNIFKAFLIIRPVNLVILAVTQICVYVFLSQENTWDSLGSPALHVLLAASLLLAVSGNIQNDLLDVKPDAINKPGRNYSLYWSSPGLLWVVYTLTALASLLLAFTLSWMVALIFLLFHLLMMLYNVRLKQIAVLGNVIISMLAGCAVLVVGLIFSSIESGPLIFYSTFAFLTTLIRELIKDLQDLEGDRAAGYRTLPILIGTRRTHMVVANVTIFAIVLMVSILIDRITLFFSGIYLKLVISYGVLCVMAPLVYVTVVLSTSGKVRYKLLSDLLKYVMVTGLATMLFF